VQSVYVDPNDDLWIIDPAAPKMQEVVKGGPKLVKVDLKTNQVAQNIPFDDDVAPKKSYLNDVRVDPKASVAFITDAIAPRPEDVHIDPSKVFKVTK
jgi:hypothetical protein